MQKQAIHISANGIILIVRDMGDGHAGSDWTQRTGDTLLKGLFCPQGQRQKNYVIFFLQPLFESSRSFFLIIWVELYFSCDVREHGFL